MYLTSSYGSCVGTRISKSILHFQASDPARSPPRCSSVEDGAGDNLKFFPASTKLWGHNRYIGSARRRIGRGGR